MNKMAEAMIHDKYIQSSSSGNNIVHDENNTNDHDLDLQFRNGQIANNQEEINYGVKPGMYLTQHPANQTTRKQSQLKIHHHYHHHQQQQQQLELERRSFKMVNFEPLPVSVKKSRPSTEQTAQKIIIAINHGVNEQDRKEAMSNACAAFDHGVETAHDDEIRVGADTTLFKHLTFLLLLRHNHFIVNTFNHNSDSFQDNAPTSATSIKVHEELLHEISQAFEGLEMVLRCSAECVSVSFARMGNELLPILLSILGEIRHRRQRNNLSIAPTDASFSLSDDHTEKIHSRTNPIYEVSKEERSIPKLQDRNASYRNHSSSIDTDDSNHISCGGVMTHERNFSPTVSKSGHENRDPNSTNLFMDKYNTSFTFPTSTDDKICKVATKILGHFARVGSLTTFLAETPNLLTTLQEVIAMPKGSIPMESQMNALWVTANLACSAENMIKMAQHPKIIQTLVQVACHPNDVDEQSCDNVMSYLKLLRSRSIAVRALLNLSWAHENKIPMSENVTLVGALLETVSHRSSAWVGNGLGVSGVLLQSRRLAAGALRNLAAAPRRYKRRLCRINESKLLDILADAASCDTDEDVRLKIHATLFNLVSADTAKMFIEKQNVLDVIVKAASSGDPYVVEPGSDTAFITAIRTLKALEKSIPEEEKNYEVLRPILRRFDSQITFDRSQSTAAMQNVEL